MKCQERLIVVLGYCHDSAVWRAVVNSCEFIHTLLKDLWIREFASFEFSSFHGKLTLLYYPHGPRRERQNGRFLKGDLTRDILENFLGVHSEELVLLQKVNNKLFALAAVEGRRLHQFIKLILRLWWLDLESCENIIDRLGQGHRH